jgi:hypothetical protein
MKNAHLWEPSKFTLTNRGLRATRDPKYAGQGESVFIGDILATIYERTIRQHVRGLLVDLGCGRVPLYQVYKNLVTDSICIDWGKTRYPLPHLDYECDLNGPIPLPSDYADTILATDVFEHMAKPAQLWLEISRMLKPSGKAIVGMPFLHNLHDEPYDYFRYTEYAIQMFCHEANLRVLLLESYGGTPEVLINLIAKHLSFSKALTAINLGFGKLLTSLAPVKRISERTKHKFPLGYCIVAQK